MKVPPPIRRHVFRYAKCARLFFMGGGASAAGRMEVYYESPPPIRRHVFRYTKCSRLFFMGGSASAAGRMEVYYESPAAD